MSWVEDTRGPDSRADNTGDADSVTRVFLFSGEVDPRAVTRDPTQFLGGPTGTEPLPAKGSQYPTDPSLLLKEYQVRRDGVNTDIIAVYTKDGGRYGRFDDDFQTRSGGFQTEVIQLPYAYKVIQKTVSVIGPDGQPVYASTPAQPWKTDQSFPILTTVRRRTVIVNVKEGVSRYPAGISLPGRRPADQLKLAIEAMRLQHNKLHYIDGVWERFEAGDYREKEYGIWEVQYNWVYESGVVYHDVLGNDPPPDIMLPPAVSNFTAEAEDGTVIIGDPDQEYYIPPYCDVRPLPAESGLATDPPRWRVLLKYHPEPNGWDSLPGYTP